MRTKELAANSMVGAFVYAVLLLTLNRAAAGDVSVAVAANFIAPAREIAAAFEADSGHRVVLSAASTGKLYAQIIHGAPFDVFLAADSAAPERLEHLGRAVAQSRFTYAVGQLALWSRDARLIEGDGAAVLREGQFLHLALANPRTAPYGVAGLAVLQRLGLEATLAQKLVRAEDVGQAFQFAATGNAELAFVALSQTLSADRSVSGSSWRVPAGWYPPILQQAVLLTSARDADTARAFLAYLRGAAGVALVERFGYARAGQTSAGLAPVDVP